MFDATASVLEDIERKHGAAWAWFALFCIIPGIPIVVITLMNWTMSDNTLVATIQMEIMSVVHLLHRIW